MKSRGEEHKGDKESDGDSEEEAFVLMETTGSSLKFHHTLLHGSEEGRKEDRQTERKKERKKEKGGKAEKTMRGEERKGKEKAHWKKGKRRLGRTDR